MKKLSLILLALIALTQGAWAQSTFSGGSGIENDPYQINSADDWNTLATNVNAGTNYKGTYFKLTNDISVTTMVGQGTNRFQGRFDGDGKTITFNVTATEDYCAPFCRISGATIRNLHTEGTITTSYRYAAGIVAYTRYTSKIQNCSSSVTILSSHAGFSGHGGIVALKANVSYSTPTIEGCVFDGKIVSTGTEASSWCGGIVGYTNGQTLTIKNCLVKLAALGDGETYADGSTFYNNSTSSQPTTTVTLKNCYYFSTLGTAQGKEVRSISAGEYVTVALAGTPTRYTVSGITAYNVGLEYNNTLYAGYEEEVSLNLGSTLTGFTFDSYTATAGGILTGSGNSYTLTMPDADVTINGKEMLTVNNGTTTNLYVPIDLYYIDNNPPAVASQFIIPASALTSIQFDTIHAMIFYHEQRSADLTSAKFDVYVLEVENDTVSPTEFRNWNNMTKVMNEGSLSFSEDKMVVTLDRPFQYIGANLLIGFKQTNKAENYVYELFWYGIEASKASIASTISNSELTIERHNFLPKITFASNQGVEPGCIKPLELAVSYSEGTTATATWTGASDNYNISINGTVIENVTSPYQLENLQLGTTYTVMVQGKCGENSTSEWSYPVSFTTDLCMPENQCALTFLLHDNEGDGWNGGAIQVVDTLTGTVIGTATMSRNSEHYVYDAVTTINVCNGRKVNFEWVPGGWDSETSYVVRDAVGDTIFSGSAGSGMIKNHMVDCFSTCRKPTGLAISNIGNHYATLSWTEHGEATAWKICLDGDETDLIDASSTSFTLTGLTPSTSYTVKVSPNDCDEDHYKWSNAITFTTDVACPAPKNVTASNITNTSATIGWTSDNDDFKLRYTVCPTSGSKDSGDTHTYNFENKTLQGWTTIDADGDGHTWMVASSFFTEPDPGYNSSTDYVMSQSYIGEPLHPDNYLVSPQVMLGGSISFFACAQDEDYPNEHFGVAVSTTGNTDASDFTTLYEWTMTEGGTPASKQGQWGQYTVDLSNYDGLVGYVAIRHFGCSDVFILNVDDITIVEGSGANLNWTECNNISNTSYSLSGLTQGTSYYVQVQSDCGSNDGSSSWSSVTVFTTLTACSAPHELSATTTASTATLNWAGAQSSYNMRYSISPETTVLNEGFEGDSVNLPAGWSLTSGYWKITSGTGYDRYSQSAATGNYNAGCFARQRDYSDTLVTPAMNLGDAVSATLSFNFWNTIWSGDVNTLNVKYRVDGGEWQQLYTTDQPTDGWTAVTINLEGMAANYQIGFECVGNYSYGMGIDDVVVTKTIDVTWNETGIDVTSPYTLTGLTPGTTYQWQVQGINSECGENGLTDWSETGSFTTLSGIDFTVTGYGTGNDKWVFIASPVSGSIAPDAVTNLIGEKIQNNPVLYNYDLYRFNQSASSEWENYHKHNTTENPFMLENGKGYLYATKETKVLNFSGDFNSATEPVEVPLAYSTENPDEQMRGWNLVGNPFTVSATSSLPYYRMNDEGSALKTETESTTVAAMEGVFVQATTDNQMVTFTTQRRGSEQAAIAQANLMVVGGNGAVIDNAILRFDGGQTLEKFSLRKGSTKIYFPQNGKDYAIACAEGQNEMPLNFEAEENGTYTLSVNPEGAEMAYLHLIDNMTGADVDLLPPLRGGQGESKQASYTFQAKTTDYTSRFKLVFAVNDGSSTGSETFAFISNGNLIVNGEGMLQVIDMMGRVIVSRDAARYVSTNGMAPGVYVLRLIDGENIKVQKIVIR